MLMERRAFAAATIPGFKRRSSCRVVDSAVHAVSDELHAVVICTKDGCRRIVGLGRVS